MDDVIQQAVAESQQAHAPEPSLADIANADKAGVPVEQGRAEAWRQAVADAKSKWEQRGPVQQFGEFAEPMVPFSQIPGISPTQKWKEMVGESQRRIAAGTYSNDDLGRAAYQHVRDEAEKAGRGSAASSWAPPATPPECSARQCPDWWRRRVDPGRLARGGRRPARGDDRRHALALRRGRQPTRPGSGRVGLRPAEHRAPRSPRA
jgi:hypothetical protein